MVRMGRHRQSSQQQALTNPDENKRKQQQKLSLRVGAGSMDPRRSQNRSSAAGGIFVPEDVVLASCREAVAQTTLERTCLPENGNDCPAADLRRSHTLESTEAAMRARNLQVPTEAAIPRERETGT